MRDQYIQVILMMMTSVLKITGMIVLISGLAAPLLFQNAFSEQIVPEWIKNIAKWYKTD